MKQNFRKFLFIYMLVTSNQKTNNILLVRLFKEMNKIEWKMCNIVNQLSHIEMNKKYNTQYKKKLVD